MATQTFDEVRSSHYDAGLRPAEELVAGEADDVSPGAEALGRSRLVSNRPQGS